jgi:AraC family transcriptional regulator
MTYALRSDVCHVERLVAPDSTAIGIHKFEGEVRTCAGYSWRNVQLCGERGFRVQSPNVRLTRLAFLLENVGARAEFRKVESLSSGSGYLARGMSLVPAGATVWAHSDRGGVLKLASLAFDASLVADQLGEDFDAVALSEQRLNFANDRVWQLGRKLADESERPASFASLYCQSAVLMLLIELLRMDENPRTPDRRGGLTKRQLDHVTEFIEQNLSTRVLLHELAVIAGLSLSHFSHAFKDATGMPPHRWQLGARIRRAQALLLEQKLPLSSVAIETGFADQAHFTRVFRKFVGTSPRAWQRAQNG